MSSADCPHGFALGKGCPECQKLDRLEKTEENLARENSELRSRIAELEAAMSELAEAYGEMEKGINDPILCHYNSMRLHNAVEDQRVLVVEGYVPNYMPVLDDESEHPEPTVNNETI